MSLNNETQIFPLSFCKQEQEYGVMWDSDTPGRKRQRLALDQ